MGSPLGSLGEASARKLAIKGKVSQMKGLRTIFAWLAVTAMSAVPGYTQAVNATLVGTVTDASGGVVANAKVTATETNTGVSRLGNTNESGNYTFPNLPPGTYSVTAE